MNLFQRGYEKQNLSKKVIISVNILKLISAGSGEFVGVLADMKRILYIFAKSLNFFS